MRHLFTFLLAFVPAMGFAQFNLPGGIPDVIKDSVKIEVPGLDKVLKAEPALSMTPDESAPALPFLDDFDPKSPAPLSEFPYMPDHGFPLAYSGVFQHHAQSYCLHAGMYGPGEGDGYTHVRLKGPMAGYVENILRNSARYPEISQSDVQGLIWAVLARSKVEDLSPEYRAIAAKLLTAKEIRDLNGGALSVIPKELREQAFSHLPPLARQAMEAEASLRDLLAQHMPFHELERVAVLSGEPPSQEGKGEFPMGRWMFDPDGYFIRYLTDSYKETTIQLYLPEAIQIVSDDKGRIVLVADAVGNRIETAYDDSVEPGQFPGDDGIKAYAFKSVRFVRPKSVGPVEVVVTDWINAGWTTIGAPSSDDTAGLNQPRYDDSQGRYRNAALHKSELDEFFPAIAKQTRRKSGDVSAADVSSLVDLAGYKLAIADVIEKDQGGADWTGHVGLVQRAWMSFLSSLVLASTGSESTSSPEQGIYVASSDLTTLGIGVHMAGEWAKSPRPKRRELPWFKPERKAAVPKRRGPQMQGQSGRAPFDSPGKRAFERSQKAVKWLNNGLLAVNVVSSPAGALQDAVGYGVRDEMFGFGMDSLFSQARKISEALGGCPPRDDYTELARPEGFTPLVHPPDSGIPTARLAALNSLADSLQRLVATLSAGVISLDRYSGALRAGDDAWAERQAVNYTEMKRRGGAGMVGVADCLDALMEQLRSKGLNDISVPPAAASEYQDRLRGEGFNAAEMAAARLIGMTAEEIEAERQFRLQADPETLGGSLFEAGSEVVESLREVGAYWATLPDPSFSADPGFWESLPSVSP